MKILVRYGSSPRSVGTLAHDKIFIVCRTGAMVAFFMDSALHVFRRFGLGRRGDESLPLDPRKWLINQLDGVDPLLATAGPCTDYGMLIVERENEANRTGIKQAVEIGALFRSDLTALLGHAATTDLPFRERLVWFWANHFSVSGKGGPLVLALTGAYIQEAIRPNVNGLFVDLLKAVMQHPCMLYYLNNDISAGPDSPVGLKYHRGLNENLARECLELYTLGVDAGYNQSDVTSFANILTGRSFNQSGDDVGFVFRPEAHEPGTARLMEQTFPAGFEGSDAVLEWLAAHPATLRHIATKMLRHFVADIPPTHCIDQVVAVLKETNGDLKQAMLAIIAMPEAWEPLAKFRSPDEYIIAVERALNLPLPPGNALLAATVDLGQSFGNALLPNGWPDTSADWITGEALLKRADWAVSQALRPGAPLANDIITATIGDVCSVRTREAVRNCPNPVEALAAVFASPEFMRR